MYLIAPNIVVLEDCPGVRLKEQSIAPLYHFQLTWITSSLLVYLHMIS